MVTFGPKSGRLTAVRVCVGGTTLKLKLLAAACAAVVIGAPVFAASLPPISDKSDFAAGDDPYQGAYFASNASTHHGFWLPGLAGGVSRYWGVDPGSVMTYDQSNTGKELIFSGTLSSNVPSSWTGHASSPRRQHGNERSR